MKKRISLIFIVALVLAIPAYAVFNERNFAQTLTILRSELHQEIVKMEQQRARLMQSNNAQHDQLVEMTRRCNELALILYSQNQDYTFDMTYALKEVTKQYEDYTKQRLPFDEIVERLNLEKESMIKMSPARSVSSMVCSSGRSDFVPVIFSLKIRSHPAERRLSSCLSRF